MHCNYKSAIHLQRYPATKPTLLCKTQEDSFNLEETHGVQIESQYSTVSPETQNSRVRGKAFSIEEDEALCRAWLAISQDPITGNSQTMAVFWERIRVCFSSQANVQQNRTNSLSHRWTLMSLSHRWTLMQKAMNKFCGFLEQVQRKNQSGMGEQDKIKEAHRMYHVFQKRPFTFDTSWEILRHSCKWNAIRTPQNNPNSQTSCSTPTAPTLCEFDVDLDQQTSPEMLKRPIGSKGEKEKKKMKAINDDKYSEIAANQTKIVEALTTISSRGIERDQEKAIDRQKRNEAREAQLQYLAMMNEREQRKEDHAIMSMDMSMLNPIQKAYYEELQGKIIARGGF